MRVAGARRLALCMAKRGEERFLGRGGAAAAVRRAKRSRELSNRRTRFGHSPRRITRNISGKLIEAISHGFEALQQ